MIRITGGCTRAQKKIGLFLFVILFFSYGYFDHQTGGWNEDSRVFTVLSILKRHSLNIDPYAKLTRDSVVVNGHTYGDKAPGTVLFSLLPAKFYDLYNLRVDRVHTTPSETIRVSRLSVAALPGALMGVAVYWGSLLIGSSLGAAIFASVALGLATPIWIFSTFVFGHVLAAGFLFAAFLCAFRIRQANPHASLFWNASFLGLFAGLSFATEYTTPPACVLIFLMAYWPRRHEKKIINALLLTLLMTLPGILMVLIYNFLIFGKPFVLAYKAHESDVFSGMKSGLLGVSYPKLSSLWEILVGRSRGLLTISPILILSVIGLLENYRSRENRWLGFYLFWISATFFIINSSYFYWDGGSSFGPRHSIPAIPFLALACAVGFDAFRKHWLKIPVFLLLAVSIVTTFAFILKDPLPIRVAESMMVQEEIVPVLVQNKVFSRNMGEYWGLSGLLALLPLGVVWIYFSLHIQIAYVEEKKQRISS